nr:MAG TPA: hypothetical protein [Bacteriophage sp.]
MKKKKLGDPEEFADQPPDGNIYNYKYGCKNQVFHVAPSLLTIVWISFIF